MWIHTTSQEQHLQPAMLRMCSCTKEEMSKQHVGLAQEIGFGSTLLHSLFAVATKRRSNALSAIDMI